MHEFPRWKLILLGLVVLAGFLFSLPNLFPQDPAVQVSANRGSVLDDAVKERVQGALEKAKIPFKAIDLEEGRLLVRLTDSERQLPAADALRAEIGEGYTVALNLASTVPAWLSSIGGTPFTLGLDLQGGVHFLMQIDEKAAQDKQMERFVDDLRSMLRTKGIRYRSVNRTPQGIVMTLRSKADRDAAYGEISRDMPQLLLSDGRQAEDSWGLVARVKETEARAEMTKALEQNIATLHNRINQLGVAEPLIQRQGDSRIVVQLPGVQDTALAKKILGATATLEYRAVDESVINVPEAVASHRIPPDSRVYYRREIGPDGKRIPVLLKKRMIVSGDELTDAAASFDENGLPAVSVTLSNVGAPKMQAFTDENVGRGMAVVFIERIPEVKVVDGKEQRSSRIKEEVISVATIQGRFGKRFQTTGLARDEASELALLLRAGSLAAPLDIVEERIIGPSLGADNIDRAFKATIVGFVLVLAFMAFYYRVFGVVAGIALIANAVLLTAILSIFGTTVTMPGIAALLLTVGMAVDANVLICERIREELRGGNTPLAAIKAGYEKAWATIVDANVTHMISGVALFAFGSGPIRGFALVLVVGIITSIFTAVTLSHAVVYLIYGRRRRLQSLAI